MSYVDFLRFEAASEGKHEWVDGVVYAMTRGTPEHARLAARMILRALGDLEGCEPFTGDVAIFIAGAKQHTYADAVLVCGALEMKTVRDRNGKPIGEALTNPTVIVEVLSDSTERYDRDGKFEAYKKLPSLEQYILVWQDEKRVEVRTRNGGLWSAVQGGSGETILVHGREVAVDAIYS